MSDSLDFSKEQIAKELSAVAKNKMDVDIAWQDFLKGIERPPEAQRGDYAVPCFRFAKVAGKKPVEIAQSLSEGINQLEDSWICEAEHVGAFLNLKINLSKLSSYLLENIISGQYFEKAKLIAGQNPDKVMIEYSQPNTHKAFHVGHMRNVALGDGLGRVYEYCGYPVTMVNYIGDEGTHIAKCIWYMRSQGEKIPDQLKGEWLGDMYAKACIKLEDASGDTKKKYEDEVSEVLRQIESKAGETFEFWKESREWSIEDFKKVYEWVDARFDHWFCESEVSEQSQAIVDEYLKKDVFIEDDGAIGLDLKNEKLGFVLLRKRDGNTLYATKDLALARLKFSEFDIKKSIYVVGAEQNLHFKQVFKTLEKMGFPQAKNCSHLSYGMVVLPDGKMSSRKGNQIIFRQLKESLEAEMSKKLERYKDEWSEQQIVETSRRLCVGAIRYGMVCSDPAKELVFSMDDWLSFEGNTGPYLMYAFARTQSILSKGEIQGFKADLSKIDLLGEQDERELLRYMNDFNNVMQLTCDNNRLSALAHHLFDMCKVYSRMLSNVNVLNSGSKDLTQARLALLASFAKILRQGLLNLGITPPDRM